MNKFIILIVLTTSKTHDFIGINIDFHGTNDRKCNCIMASGGFKGSNSHQIHKRRLVKNVSVTYLPPKLCFL